MFRRRARVTRRPRRVAGGTAVSRGSTVRDEETFVSSSRMLQPVKTHPSPASNAASGYQLNAAFPITAPGSDAAARFVGAGNNVQIILLNGISQGSAAHQRSPSSLMCQMRTLYLKAGIAPPSALINTTVTAQSTFHSMSQPQFLQMLVVYDKRPTNPPSFPSMADFYENASDPMSHMPMVSRSRWDILYRKTWSWKYSAWNFSPATGIYNGQIASMICDSSNSPLIDIRIPINRVVQFINTPTANADPQAVSEIVTGHLYLVFVAGTSYSLGYNVELYAYPRLSFVDL